MGSAGCLCSWRSDSECSMFLIAEQGWGGIPQQRRITIRRSATSGQEHWWQRAGDKAEGLGNQIGNYELDSKIRNSASNPGHCWHDVSYCQICSDLRLPAQAVSNRTKPGRMFLGKRRRKGQKVQSFCSLQILCVSQILVDIVEHGWLRFKVFFFFF